jgi:hypothetical protein
MNRASSLPFPQPEKDFTPEHPNFKTKICRHWLKGHCNRGLACNFAHGFNQVVQRKSSPKTITVNIYHEIEKGENKKEYNSMNELIDDYDIITKRDFV